MSFVYLKGPKIMFCDLEATENQTILKVSLYNTRQKSLRHLHKTDKNHIPEHLVFVATYKHPLLARIMLVRVLSWFSTLLCCSPFYTI